MTKLAVLIGVSKYASQPDLPCCENDVEAVRELVEATGAYDNIVILINPTASQLKEGIRTALSDATGLSELFFYYSGHGTTNTSDFFFCPTDFDSSRPNETGLSNDDLHLMLRSASADLIVKIVDACASGTLLLKSSDSAAIKAPNSSFKNVIQISSCLNNQESMAGSELSPFTENLRSAILSKETGPVYFSDIISSLRDKFINNESQIPHFVLQYTDREVFVDDAKKLADIRHKVNDEEQKILDSLPSISSEMTQPSLVDRLRIVEARYANADQIKSYIDGIVSHIDGILFDNPELTDYFETAKVSSHRYEDDDEQKEFMVRALLKEARPDNFVHAAIERTPKNRYLSGSLVQNYAFGLSGIKPIEHDEDFELDLNYKLNVAQLVYSLTPKFRSLSKFSLLINFAPSLEKCYTFERVRLHKLYDDEKFEISGLVLEKRWYKRLWTEKPEQVATKISDRILQIAAEHVETVARDVVE